MATKNQPLDATGETTEVADSPATPGVDNDNTKGTTTLDSHVDAPSITAPGDGPADTMDPTERATSVLADKGAAALAGHLTVNSVLPLPPIDATKTFEGEGRIEEYPMTKPNGEVVTVVHNIDTGETRIK